MRRARHPLADVALDQLGDRDTFCGRSGGQLLPQPVIEADARRQLAHIASSGYVLQCMTPYYTPAALPDFLHTSCNRQGQAVRRDPRHRPEITAEEDERTPATPP